ncbi:Iron-sulfur cluster biosynthesis [Fragilaria crotonensis]|nr:Iron-sulfur cluster biosynthesis [Fragilaria crotonensis]
MSGAGPRFYAATRLVHLPQARSLSMITKTTAGSISLGDASSKVPASTSSSSSLLRNAIVTDDLSVTSACLQRIRALAAKRQDPSYLRVFVDAGGCSGFQYKFDMTEDKDEPVDPVEDVVFESDGARVVVDTASLDFIKGSTIDFVQEMIKSSFAVVDNPQSESACGCGSSFAVKKFQSNPALD